MDHGGLANTRTGSGRVDLNADLGEGFGPWRMGDDAAMLALVSTANVACGGHAGDADTMVATLAAATARGVAVGAHPGFADPAGFGRRVIPMDAPAIERMVAVQVGALLGAAALAGARVRHVKLHGALANLAAADRGVADAVARAVAAVSRDLAVLAIAGTAQVAAAQAQGLAVFGEVFADRGYRPDGLLLPRGHPGALIHDPQVAAARIVAFMDSGLMPTQDGPPVRLPADSICVHGDSPGAVAMAQAVRAALMAAGVAVVPFLSPAG